jgi:predicted ATP-dependent endonuclease of OLD family
MRLTRASIEGYRSIRECLHLQFDERTTVILGANDHGKTNVLHALLHLNPEHGFDTDGDLNFDLEDRSGEFPALAYTLRLSKTDRTEIFEAANHGLRKRAIDEFVEQIDQIDDGLHGDAATAEQEAKKAQDTARELQAAAATSAESDPESETTKQAQAAAAEAARLAEAANTRAQQARAAATESRDRFFLAVAEQLKADAQQRGVKDFDLEAEATAAEKALGRAKAAVTREQPKVEAAQTEHQQAVGQFGVDTEQAKEAQAKAEAAQQGLATAEKAVEHQQETATDLRAAADAAAKATRGDLAFSDDLPLPEPEPFPIDGFPSEVVLERQGLDGELTLIGDVFTDDPELRRLTMVKLPRVELIRPQDHLSDEADPKTIDAEDNDFMRGIFRYAGLAPEEWPGIFKQTDKTTKRLDTANKKLNETLRDAWSQGQHLEFRLDHREGKIDLQISDPAVEGRYVRASRRSSGFTHFFAVKTMLFAREQAANASSFIWLFDEPGIFLHPQGQHDLLQVLETLAQGNQVIYTTHSIFLFNKNHPTRHRLLTKNERGTQVDQKPFAGQWRAAIDALGLSLPGTVLFASKVLLVEGDSDPILLNADLQKLIEFGVIDIDINPLSIMSTGDSKHADALIRILLDAAVAPEIALLFDGDKGGDDRRKSLKRLIKDKKLPTHSLPDGLAGEDCILSPKQYLEATVRYVQNVCGDEKKNDEIRRALETSYTETFGADPPKGLAKWSREQGRIVLEEEEDISPVGVAREYALLIAEATAEELPPADRERAEVLAKQVIQMLDLQPQTLDDGQIIET